MMSSTTQQQNGDGKFHFAIDRGGTFTDVHCKLPNGTELASKIIHWSQTPIALHEI